MTTKMTRRTFLKGAAAAAVTRSCLITRSRSVHIP